MHRSPCQRADQLLTLTARAAALVAGAVLLLLLLFLVKEALPALRSPGMGAFLTDAAWHPTESELGMLPMAAGSLLAAGGALLLAFPLGVLSALFCCFYAPAPLASAYRRLLGLLAGIPSVVFGFWGLVVLVPLLNRVQPPGTSLLAAILVLALMVLPTLALTADAGLRALPPEYFAAAAALGMSRATTIYRVALPAARSSLATAVVLATGRALGETMAVLMVAGNVVQVPRSLFDPVRTLTANIALEMAYAMGSHRSALFVSGLLLAVLVGALVLAAEAVSRRPARG